jgi:hypothetical protein
LDDPGNEIETSGLVSDISRDVLEAYGSLDQPNFAFEQDPRRLAWYREALEEIAAHFLLDMPGQFTLANVTDANCDHACVLQITGVRTWLFRLSLVGRYAVLLRASESTLKPLTLEEATEEHEFFCLDVLRRNGIRILSSEILERPIALNLLDTDIADMCLYQALFLDDDVLPWKRILT